MTIRNLQSVFAPKSVALIGASGEAPSVGYTTAQNLLSGGFKGPVYFVNPKRGEILGQRAYPDIASLPQVPDLAIVATPAQSVPGVIATLGEVGTRGAVVVSAGVRGDLKTAMLQAGRPHMVRIVGPNCIGLLVPPLGLNGSFAHLAPMPGDLAFLSQSGAIITSVIDWAANHKIGFSHIVSMGDMADVDFGDMLDYLAGDIRSRAILLYIESITNAQKFISAARRAARSKPVIVVKSGRRAEGARAAASHTGALAGADRVYDAAFRRAGVLRVMELDELFDAAEMLSRIGAIEGERLVILTNGGGAGVLAADRLGDERGRLASLTDETMAALDVVLPATWSRGNPVDILGDASAERYAQALDAVMKDKNTDAVLIIACPVAVTKATDAAEAVIKTIASNRGPYKKNKAVLTNWLGQHTAEPAREMFISAKIPTFETPSAAVRGFMQLVRYSRAQVELTRTPPALPQGMAFDDTRVAEVIAHVRDDGRTLLSEAEAKQVLEAYGIPIVPTRTVGSVAEVADAARDILKGPEACVIKVLADKVTHKSDVGGVRLELVTPEEAQDAAQDMVNSLAALGEDIGFRGFTVQPMIRRPHGHELIIGMSEDPTFGPVILFGAGGTAVEATNDTALALPPLDLKLAHDLMEQTRISRLLDGYRKRPAADRDAIAMALVRLSYLIAHHPVIRELDVNPLFADDKGIIALDARIRIAAPDEAGRAPMAIRPYPTQWERHVTHETIGTLFIRPMRPDDETAYGALMERMDPEDIRLRLLAPRTDFNHKFLARMTQLDYSREMAFCAYSEETGDLLGVVRLTADPDYTSAEYAVMVRSDLKGQGLGWLMMAHLIRYARHEGLNELYGTVLRENATMLYMCRELGFKVKTDPDDPRAAYVVLDLAAANVPAE